MRDKRLIDAVMTVSLIRMGEMNEYTEFGEGFNAGIAWAIETVNRMPTECVEFHIEIEQEKLDEIVAKAVERILEERRDDVTN